MERKLELVYARDGGIEQLMQVFGESLMSGIPVTSLKITFGPDFSRFWIQSNRTREPSQAVTTRYERVLAFLPMLFPLLERLDLSDNYMGVGLAEVKLNLEHLQNLQHIQWLNLGNNFLGLTNPRELQPIRDMENRLAFLNVDTV